LADPDYAEAGNDPAEKPVLAPVLAAVIGLLVVVVVTSTVMIIKKGKAHPAA